MPWDEKKTDVEKLEQKQMLRCNMKNCNLMGYHVLFWQVEINMLHEFVMRTVRSASSRFYVRNLPIVCEKSHRSQKRTVGRRSREKGEEEIDNTKLVHETFSVFTRTGEIFDSKARNRKTIKLIEQCR